MTQERDSSADRPSWWARMVPQRWTKPDDADFVPDPYQATTSYPVDQVRARLQDPQWARGNSAGRRASRTRSQAFPDSGSVAPAANQRGYSG